MLSSLLPNCVVYPNTTEYATSNTYWSARQSELGPNCFVTPHNASEVSTILKALTETQSSFTVKGGGHTAFPNGSSIDDGVTIDLAHLNEVTVHDDEKGVSVGPGARWGNVSTVLDSRGLAVAGGRVNDVGVAGLILGGGISYFSGRRGWACDNVQSFEVVVPSGEILTATPEKGPDLYWALRGGGGSSFGIVTRFDLEAFPQGDLWSGSFIHAQPTAKDELLPLLPNLIEEGLEDDADAHMFTVYSYQPDAGGYVSFTSTYHAKPSELDPESVPAVFEPVKDLSSISSTVKVGRITELSSALGEPYGVRATWWDTSISGDAPASLLEEIVGVFESFVAAIQEQGNFTPFLIFQPITKGTVVQMQKNGGNALGLKPEDGALWIIQLSARWEDPSLDEAIEKGAQKVVDDVERVAKEQDMLRGFKYMNYAGSEQDVLGSYGKENIERLRKVAQKYDAEHVLPQLWDGYFHVGH